MPNQFSRTTLTDRFWLYVQKTEGCWLWTGSIVRGYGKIRTGGVKAPRIAAHRLSWELHRGVVPDGMFVLHRCDVRNCVNPDHLFLGTNADNMADMARKGRAASGERNPMRLRPELRVTGERHWTKQRPEAVLRGAKNGRAKLTAADVVAIRERYALGGISQSRLGAEYGVTQNTISRIVLRQGWVESE